MTAWRVGDRVEIPALTGEVIQVDLAGRKWKWLGMSTIAVRLDAEPVPGMGRDRITLAPDFPGLRRLGPPLPTAIGSAVWAHTMSDPRRRLFVRRGLTALAWHGLDDHRDDHMTWRAGTDLIDPIPVPSEATP